MEFSKVRGGSSADLRPLDVAEAEARALIALDADAPYGHALLGFVGYERGQLPAAARHLTRAHELDPSDTNAPELPYTVQLSALVDAMEGRRDAALEALARLDLAALDAHHIFHIAEAYAMAGDTPRALTLLERAVDHGMYPYRFYTEHCPFTVPLRGSPEFARIVDKAARRVAEFSA